MWLDPRPTRRVAELFISCRAIITYMLANTFQQSLCMEPHCCSCVPPLLPDCDALARGFLHMVLGGSHFLLSLLPAGPKLVQPLLRLCLLLCSSSLSYLSSSFGFAILKQGALSDLLPPLLIQP